MRLIITEKDNAARRIAEILSDGSASADRRNGVNVYRWGDKRVVGLSGHVVGMDFPPEYADWRDVEPVELIDADVRKEPTQENIVATLKSLARKADEAVIATDYDREGELIGKEAYELIREVTDIPVERVRFSSITDREVREAFADPDDIDFDLAAAGEARQVIDLVWGAALTRFLSLSARQLGEDFISVGRVQSPTLKLIVDREREIETFEPEAYWELFADLGKDGGSFEAQYFYDDDGSEAERVWDEAAAEAAYADLSGADAATVTGVRRRTRTDSPPTPFNTTAFISAAGSLGYSAQRAMSIAEELYTAGYITYPRTDNTVYPEDLEEDALLDAFVGSPFGEAAESLLEQDEIVATEGDEETTDHPPIHPTDQLPARSDLSEDEWELYELVVRRFFATVAEPATWEHLRVTAEAAGRALKANGKRLVEPGYHAVYPYSGASETHVPDVEEGENLTITEVRMADKETQPPRRYGQSRLIQKMEDLGLGTKCLTGDTNVLTRTKDGDIERKPISSVFEDGQVLLSDGDTDIATSSGSPTVLSLDETAVRTTERESTLLSERSLEEDEQILDITTDRATISVTDEHPMYVWQGNEIGLVPARDVEPGTELVAARRPDEAMTDEVSETVASWEEFAAYCDKESKLYGADCGEEVKRIRSSRDESQAEFADQLNAHRPAITRYESGDKDVPIWLCEKLGIRPEQLHGLNYDRTIPNPFPLEWSPELARILGSLLGDGSIVQNETENVIDIRYHNTDSVLIERFSQDIETVFGVDPMVSERSGRESHHKTKYQVRIPAALGRLLVYILDRVTENGCPVVPEELQPAFIGALFDDEGHISRERKAFISNTDYELLQGVSEMLETNGIETKLARDQSKLHIRGRRNLEKFLDRVPVASDDKFYRGLDSLAEYEVTTRKAEILTAARSEAKTSATLASELSVSQGTITRHIRELREDGHLKKVVEGSNRSPNQNRTIKYATSGFEQSIYATVAGVPSRVPVRKISERNYDGSVYDITVDETAPNFSVEGGAVVHNSTRHNTIEKLYDRGYIEGDPPRPTRLAMAVVEAAEEFADHVVSDEMTARLEQDMTAIADGGATLDEVTQESREMLRQVFEELRESREEVGEHLQESLKADRTVGPCPECGEDMLVRRSRQGSYFVGCDGFPDCRNTYPLPSTGEPLVLDGTCEDHGMHEVKMLAGRDTFVHGCPRCQAEQADETDDEVIGPCPDCGDTEGGELAIKHLRSGSRLVGCVRYPDCDYSLPLPRNGEIAVTDTYCDEHDQPELVIDPDSDDPWELGCPICNYQEYQARNAVEDLEDLDGVGPATAEKLEAAGVDSPEALSEADAGSLAGEVQGVSESRVREWQSELGD